MRSIPLYDESATIACTITAAEVPDRIAVLERMRLHLDRLERTDHGLRLHFPPAEGLEADLRRFADDEKRCCQFWGFDVSTDPGLSLRWDAPPSAAELVDRLEQFFTGTEPASSLDGLL